MDYDIADWKTQYLSLRFDSLASAKTMKTFNFMTEFFTIYQLGIFRLKLGKKDTFWHWEWGPISGPDLA